MSENFTVVYTNGNLSSKNVCRLFGISESTLRSWEKKGSIKAVSVNGLKEYNVREVDVMFRSMNKKNQIPRIFPDSFYWMYEDPKIGIKIDSWDKYISYFHWMKEPFENVNDHKYSTDKLDNYEFDCLLRADSPLANHKVRFKPKNDHPKLSAIQEKCVTTPLPLEFEVFYDTIDAKPSGDSNNNNHLFTVNYIRIEPFFITFNCYGFMG